MWWVLHGAGQGQAHWTCAGRQCCGGFLLAGAHLLLQAAPSWCKCFTGSHPTLPILLPTFAPRSQVAFETDGTCAVTLMVLGDSKCSGSDNITTFSG